MCKFKNNKNPKLKDSATKLVTETHNFGDMEVKVTTAMPDDSKTETN